MHTDEELRDKLKALQTALEAGREEPQGPEYTLPTDIPDGVCYAVEKVTIASMMIANITQEDRIKDLINTYLAFLPKGTEASYTQHFSYGLCVPFELKFTNRLFKTIKTVQLEYVRHVELIDGLVEQYNVFTGINYFDKDGKKLFEYSPL